METYKTIDSVLNTLKKLEEYKTLDFVFFIRKKAVTRLFASYNTEDETLDMTELEDVKLFGFLAGDDFQSGGFHATRQFSAGYLIKKIEEKYSRLLTINNLIEELA